ncbi:uncharacterized protein LOC122077747 isoform X3 [Macadamia integrifolia]|uniref:uncharacterized protein LOC122077747 isoform X3 n=1 Tax=Macadamia integrifolia TaxID=60698 RepID=UPI001C4EDAE4|nr:uncharacterized protein LOC122077747 isoform X3 [Macadamia integrifolia]
MGVMGKNGFVLALLLMVLLGCLSSASATDPARIVTGFVSNGFSALLKWLWSLKATTKTAVSGRPMVKFESGYTVETVFDGSKLGIEPYTVEVSNNGELLILDSANSNIYKISSPLSRYSRPKLVAGSSEGYSGHVDGKLREARMNQPKGLTVDDRGNIYIADTMNMAIRKISDAGVTTIAGGKWSRGGGYVDGPSEDAKFSSDFDVVYIGSSCSLLVIDRGNQAIREIQLHFDDCAYQYGSGFPLGIAVLVAAGFFGYMLALLQRRVCTIVSAQNQDCLQQKRQNAWPLQESFVIPDEDEPPSIETRTPTPRKTYAFMTNDPEKTNHFRQSRAFYSGWDGDFQQQQQHHQQPQQHHQRHYSSGPKTCYEQSSETTNEIVFGAVQDGRREAVVIKAVDYGDPIYDHRNFRSRGHYVGYAHGY